MALNAGTVTSIALARYQEKMQEEFPDVVKNQRILKLSRDDGSVEYEVLEERGPIEIDIKSIKPLISAIAEAVVEHITEHGEVRNVTSGLTTRKIT